MRSLSDPFSEDLTLDLGAPLGGPCRVIFVSAAGAGEAEAGSDGLSLDLRVGARFRGPGRPSGTMGRSEPSSSSLDCMILLDFV